MISVKNMEDIKLNPCPFCGCEGEICSVVHSSGCNQSGQLPEGAVMVDKCRKMVGGYLYYWKRYGYLVRCTNVDCVARSISRKYVSKSAAAEAWNHLYKGDHA